MTPNKSYYKTILKLHSPIVVFLAINIPIPDETRDFAVQPFPTM